MSQREYLRTLLPLLAALALVTGCTQANLGAESTSTIEPSAELALVFAGQVENELRLSRADLERIEMVEKTIEHPKDGDQTYTGVMLSTLLARAQPSGDAILTFTAVDAYSVDVPASDAEQCAGCMVAFDGDTLRLVMPGFGSSFWVKDVVSVEAK